MRSGARTGPGDPQPDPPARLRHRVGALSHFSESLARGRPDEPTIDPGDLTEIAGACRDCVRLRFDYERRDGVSGGRITVAAPFDEVVGHSPITGMSVEAVDATTGRLQLRADTHEWLAVNVALLPFPVLDLAPDELVAEVRVMGVRLRSAAPV